MSVLADKRVVIGLGALVAVGVGAAIALGLGRDGDRPPPPAAEGGLQIEIGETERAALDPTKPLRCFVDGRLIGMETLSACAQRNGVAAQALDVGLDETGALAAATTPPPPSTPSVDIAADDTPPPVKADAPVVTDLPPPGGAQSASAGSGAQFGSCISHGPNGWTTMSEAAPLGVCVTLLFDGRCETPGNARYGRWGEQTIRLVPGKVEISADGQTFTTLAEQGQNCSVPRI